MSQWSHCRRLIPETLSKLLGLLIQFLYRSLSWEDFVGLVIQLRAHRRLIWKGSVAISKLIRQPIDTGARGWWRIYIEQENYCKVVFWPVPLLFLFREIWVSRWKRFFGFSVPENRIGVTRHPRDVAGIPESAAESGPGFETRIPSSLQRSRKKTPAPKFFVFFHLTEQIVPPPEKTQKLWNAPKWQLRSVFFPIATKATKVEPTRNRYRNKFFVSFTPTGIRFFIKTATSETTANFFFNFLANREEKNLKVFGHVRRCCWRLVCPWTWMSSLEAARVSCWKRRRRRRHLCTRRSLDAYCRRLEIRWWQGETGRERERECEYLDERGEWGLKSDEERVWES